MVLRIIILILLCSNFSVFAQSHFHLDNYYQSPTDNLVTIKSISVLPFTDNTRGIYAKSFHNFIKNEVDENPKWNLEPIEIIGKHPYINELERDKNKILGYAKNVNADAFLVGRIDKTEKALNIKLALFLAKDGLLLAKEETLNVTISDFEGLNKPYKDIFTRLIKQLPYDGLILSRKDQLVTLNLSKSDGILDGQDLTVASIIKLQRHPKFNFLINSEKVILGKLRVTKVDDSLTFAKIIVEKEKGSIQKGGKIVGSHLASFGTSVMSTKATSNYVPSNNAGTGTSIGGVTTGESWKPTPPPTFGKAGVTGGLGLMKKDSGNAYSKNNIVPSITLEGEVWINNQWSAHAMLHQSIASIGDPDGEADLSLNNSAIELMGGYNYRMGGVYGTKFEILAGFSRFSSSVESADPNKFTSLRYSGIKVGADIVTPISGSDLLAGATFYLFLKPKLKEKPSPTGSSSSNTITQFRVYGLKKYKENFYLKGVLKYDNYSTSFSRAITASRLGERNLSLNLGMDYYF